MSKYNLNLIAINDITFDNKRKLYQATGNDPFFYINLSNRTLKAGWYWLSIQINPHIGLPMASKIYFDYGRGFNEEDIWLLPKLNENKIETLVKFPFDILNLRFDPSISHCSFSIEHFSLKPLGKFQAFQKAIKNYSHLHRVPSNYFSIAKSLFSSFIQAGIREVKGKMKESVLINHSELLSEYMVWSRLYDTIGEDDIKLMKIKEAEMPYRPLVSVIMPVYNPPSYYFKKAIESVLNQSYSNWELCIADDCSPQPEVKKIMRDYAARDSRIKILFRERNGHISEASNSALTLATGEFMALLDQDDELRPHSLFMVAEALSRDRNLKLIYSDEDKIDENGVRFDPYFKTDWNPDLFYGQNMISHLGVYHLALAKELGGFRKGYEGSQDFDLALRFTEKIQSRQIFHIPHVLYHWRAIPGSTAVEVKSKNYAYNAGIKTLADHLKRTKQNAEEAEHVNHSYKVKWKLPKIPPLVSIIIPTRNRADLLETCVNSLLQKTNYPNFEILIVDNDSDEETTFTFFRQIQQHDRVRVFPYRGKFNFSAIMNEGVRQAKGEVVVLLNNDTSIINSDWLSEMTSQALRKEIGAVGAKLYYPNGMIQHAGVFLYEGHPGVHIYCKRIQQDPGYFNKLNLVQNYSAVSAACLAIRRKLYLEAGGFDEKNLKVAYNDVDFCLRLREMGYRNLWTPFAELYHYESLSRGSDFDPMNLERFKAEHTFMIQKWNNIINKDPFFNGNLSCETLKTEFAHPPKVNYPWKTYLKQYEI